MSILKLDVLSLRNIFSASLEPCPKINFIIGSNASGKSTLLEAIFILGRARSFRTNHLRQVISFDHPQSIVTAKYLQPNGSETSLGIQIDSKQYQIRIDLENRQKSDLAYVLPLQLIQPNSYQLLTAGPQYRREFMDWGIFNHKSNFLPVWRRFSKALQQRNSLLKTRQLQLLPAWDKEIVENGGLVNNFREEYIEQLQPVFLRMTEYFLNSSKIDIRFNCGWDVKNSLEQGLRTDLEKDLRYGFTHSGPHRADFLTYHNKLLAKDYLSRGQLKLLMLSLFLSQINLLSRDVSKNCCILVDDLTAELDTENRSKLLKYLAEIGCQVFITATSLADFGDLKELQNYKVFHVEQGCIKQL